MKSKTKLRLSQRKRGEQKELFGDCTKFTIMLLYVFNNSKTNRHALLSIHSLFHKLSHSPLQHALRALHCLEEMHTRNRELHKNYSLGLLEQQVGFVLIHRHQQHQQ